MPYCGRCLNVGKAGKGGAPPEYGPTSTVVCFNFVRLNRLRTGPASAMMTEVTTGFAKSHASERCAGLHSCPRARS